jgi:hypothetical protein
MTDTQSSDAETGRYTHDPDQVLAVFRDFYDQDEIKFAEYLVHCRIEDLQTVEDGESFDTRILAHYRIKPGIYDPEAVAQDLLRWPEIAAYVAKCKREQRRQEKARADRKRKAKPRR